MYVENDGVVDSDAHQYPNKVVMSLVSLLAEREPIKTSGRMVHEHLVLGLYRCNNSKQLLYKGDDTYLLSTVKYIRDKFIIRI